MTCIICGGKSKIIYNDLYDDRYGAPGRHDIYQCINCGFGRTFPGLKKKNIAKFYSNFYPLSLLDEEQVRNSASIPPIWRQWISGNNNIAHRYIKPHSKVLDIGSGSGVSLLEIIQLGAEAYGVEPDPNAQKLARSLKLNVYKGFISDNPFPDIKFNYITASQVIEHEPNPTSFLINVRKHLRDDGIIIFSFPNSDALYRKIFGRYWLHWHVPYHVNHFNTKSIKLLAKKAQLKITSIRTITPNLWTILQLRTAKNYTGEGIPNPVWSGTKNSFISKPVLSIIPNILLNISMTFIAFILIINRLLDIFGQGESLLVFMEKNEKK